MPGIQSISFTHPVLSRLEPLIAGEEAGRDSVLTEALAGYLATILAGSDGEAKLAAVW
jgi:hypothetical protein